MMLIPNPPKLPFAIPRQFLFLFPVLIMLTLAGYFFQQNLFLGSRLTEVTTEKTDLVKHSEDLGKQLEQVKTEIENLKNEDQFKKNEALEKEIKDINLTYQQAVSSYEKILELREQKVKTENLEKDFAQTLKLLAERKYQEAQNQLADLDNKINSEREKLAAGFKIPENVTTDNTPPTAGYRRQKVQTEIGAFLVDIVSADLNSTRVTVDTASESDCANDCPVLSLADYVSRNGAFAGVNGSYFCPATYPSCAGKTNSFDTLLMNKDKKYFNSENNVYSTVPAVIFYGNTARFVAQSLEWGRDTNVDAVLANQPLLLLNHQVRFGGSDDPKKGSKGNRSFVGATGNTVYLGVVHSATVAESARALFALGLDNALNLDDGGSTALWSGGYKVGPGRNLPNVLLLIRK